MLYLYINSRRITQIATFDDSISLNNETKLLEESLIITIPPYMLHIADIKQYFNEGDEYSKKGYKYFKLEGRTLPSSDIFALYLYYLVKPEYYFEMISEAACWEGIFYNDINSERQFDTLLTPIQEQSVTYL